MLYTPVPAFHKCPYNIWYYNSLKRSSISLSMRFFTVTLLLTTALAVPHDGISVEDRYIVTLHPTADISSHMVHVEALHSAQTPSHFEGISQTYTYGDFQAYSGHFSPQLVDQLRSHNDIQHIEADQPIRGPETDFPESSDDRDPKPRALKSKAPPPTRAGTLVEQKDAPWNLAVLSQRDVLRKSWGDGSYTYDSSAGQGTYGYVVDTGVMLDHPDFQGRATWGYSVRKKQWRVDPDGHGTHVASTMCGAQWGVAKKCNIIAVKTMGSDWGSMSTVLDGLQWSVRDILAKKRAAKSVVNLSVSDKRSFAMNAAVNGAYLLGVSVVAAAGNEGGRDPKVSPGGARGAITVGAIDHHGFRASWSNYGRDVNVYAPGYQIRAANGIPGPGRSSSIVKSGTSMATPHVSGLVLYLKGFKVLASAKATKQAVLGLATPVDLHDWTREKYTIRIAYNGCGK